MPEHARIRGTPFTHAADELIVAPELRELQWSCIGCDADMMPVAWDPERTFKTQPYFRLELGCDHFQCVGADFRVLEGRVYTGRYSQGMPSSLRLPAQRINAVPVVQRPVNVDGAELGRAGARPAHAPQIRTDGTFSMIARSFVQFPDGHDQMLRLFNWPEKTYGNTFWRLINYTEHGPRAVDVNRIYFGPLSHDKAEIGNNGQVSFYLNRGYWRKATSDKRGEWVSRFRVTVDLSAQHPGHQTTIINNIVQWIHEQSLIQREAQDAIGCFFIGLQDQDVPNDFTITDPRLMCFLNTPKSLFDLPRQTRRRL